jgi:hypothetical protein
MPTNDDPSVGAWDDACRLLDERGPWTTDGGAYLESEEVTVLVHPVHDIALERDSGAETVDLVVTVRARRPGSLPPGAGVRLVGSAGRAVFRPLGPRGQAVFRALPSGQWSARLVDGGQEASAAPQAAEAEVIPLRTISRLLAPAAGDRRPVVQETYTSVDGRLTTAVEETPDARLVVRVSAVDRPGRVALVRMQWALVLAETTDDVRTLVFPLAAPEEENTLVAKYDLGSLDRVQAVKIAPAEWAEPSELTGDLVRQAFTFSLYGTARRAWEHLVISGLCPPAVEAVLRDNLDREPQ